MSAPVRPPVSWLVPMALGAVLCAGLWLIGLPELGWLGFLLAAFAWPAVRQVRQDRPGAAGSDGDGRRAP
jgi:hypothetical protein